MVELQILNKILKQKSMNLVNQNGVDDTYFIKYKSEYEFIVEHYNKYGVVPDEITMCSKFDDFDPFDCTESDKYLVEKIKESHLYAHIAPLLNKMAEICQVDSKDAVDYLLTQLPDIVRLMGGFNEGYDLIKNSKERETDYKMRAGCGGLLGIPSGLNELDEILHGWLGGEDLITIVGRTNEGKSWILLFFLVTAWASGKRVLLYSGEMGRLMVGYRFDTLARHFSNLALMTGNLEQTDLKIADYEIWLEELSKHATPFIIVTPKDFGGKEMTVPMLNTLIEQYRPDIVGIDQYSLMADARFKRGDPKRVQLANISSDLYKASEYYKIPIIADAQANRKAGEKKKGEAEADTPELDEVGESDAIVQNSSRVIGIKQTGAGLKISVKKNRYGLNNKDLLYFWDIDKGNFKNIVVGENTPQGQQKANQQADNEYQDGSDVF